MLSTNIKSGEILCEDVDDEVDSVNMTLSSRIMEKKSKNNV